MDVREKLVEVLKQAPFEGKVLDEWWGEEKIKRIADHLISNGVTVQEWISVDDRLPKTDGIYIVCDCRLNGNLWIHTAGFRKASSSWCELHGVYYDDGYGRYSEQDKITYWMPLPNPPKGE